MATPSVHRRLSLENHKCTLEVKLESLCYKVISLNKQENKKNGNLNQKQKICLKAGGI